jgi:hypothetical protein
MRSFPLDFHAEVPDDCDNKVGKFRIVVWDLVSRVHLLPFLVIEGKEREVEGERSLACALLRWLRIARR